MLFVEGFLNTEGCGTFHGFSTPSPIFIHVFPLPSCCHFLFPVFLPRPENSEILFAHGESLAAPRAKQKIYVLEKLTVFSVLEKTMGGKRIGTN